MMCVQAETEIFTSLDVNNEKMELIGLIQTTKLKTFNLLFNKI